MYNHEMSQMLDDLYICLAASVSFILISLLAVYLLLAVPCHRLPLGMSLENLPMLKNYLPPLVCLKCPGYFCRRRPRFDPELSSYSRRLMALLCYPKCSSLTHGTSTASYVDNLWLGLPSRPGGVPPWYKGLPRDWRFGIWPFFHCLVASSWC